MAHPEHRRGQAQQGRALQRVDGRPATHHLEQARHDVDLHAQLVAHPYDTQARLVVCGERQHNVLDVVLLQDLRQVVGRSQHRHVGQLLMQRQRVGVDEPDQVEAVVGLSHHFPRDLLTHQPGADDHRVLLERGTAPQAGADDAPVDRHRDDRDHPEAGHVATVEVSNGTQLG